MTSMARHGPDAPDRRPLPGGPPWPAALALLGLLALSGCQRDEVAHFRVPKVSAVPATAALPPPGAPGQGRLRWTLPAGWTDAPGGNAMRFATIRPPGAGKVDVSVVFLPGPAGGELANVNRWRGQLALPPLDEAGLPAARTPLRTAAGEVAVYDFTAAGASPSRTVAGLASVAGDTWFVKMTGEGAAVAAARPAFLQLLGSLRLEDR